MDGVPNSLVEEIKKRTCEIREQNNPNCYVHTMCQGEDNYAVRGKNDNAIGDGFDE
jgi:hypothetical protein